MLFAISKILSSFTDPVEIVFLLLLASALLRLMAQRRWAWCGIGTAIGLMAVVIFTPLDYWLLSPLEERFPLPNAPLCLDGIVMIGGGEAVLESARLGTFLVEGSPMRYVVLGELMRRYPAAKVVITAGSGLLAKHVLSEADVAKGMLGRLDLDSSRPRFESASRTTWENAVNAKEFAQPKPGERWALLAAAFQMPRAVGAFRKAGWDILPWPTDYVSGAPVWWLQDPSQRFRMVYVAEHEWLGLITYWMTSRSSELFPAPSVDASREDACAG
jgi:uncharacterized SAM-binding protein YcdF (DUF218 family)